MMRKWTDIEMQYDYWQKEVEKMEQKIAEFGKLQFDLKTAKQRVNQLHLLNDIRTGKITCVESSTGNPIPTNFS